MNDLLTYYSETVPLFMTVASLVIVAMEWISLTFLRKIENHKEGWVNVLSAALTFLPIFLLNAIFTTALMFGLYQFRLFDLGLEWYVWILAYIAYDFMAYAIHYLSHKVRILWCIHSVHHSAKEMKASVAFRGSFADFLITPQTSLWLPLLGFHPLMILIVEGFAMIYGVPLHLNENSLPKGKWTGLRKLFITPAAHRLHHANNDIYLDTNYGLTFSIWDKIFKTEQAHTHEKPVYGLTKEINSANIVIAQTDEWVCLWRDLKSAPRLIDKVKYLIMPPGWNHVDGGETARVVRERALGAGVAMISPTSFRQNPPPPSTPNETRGKRTTPAPVQDLR